MLLLGAAALLITGCKAPPAEPLPTGDVNVQIPVSESSESGEPQYKLKIVTLKNISSLKAMSGQYARFFHAPGLVAGTLNGSAPVAYFAKTKDNVFIPKDERTLEMATLYYHMQNLMKFAQDLGIAPASTMPIGLNTQIRGSESLRENNAFYDGRSRAMLFVPFTSSELPISVNAGIVAHEFFHSIFYREVLQFFGRNKIPVSQKQNQKLSDLNVHSFEGWSQNINVENLTETEMYNETYLRGINEGLADFWAWMYTNDQEFIKWSIPRAAETRSLKKPMLIDYQTSEKIQTKLEHAISVAENPTDYLSDYIYEVGTPYARFLKELTLIKSQNGMSLDQAKKEMSIFIHHYIQALGIKARVLTKDEKLSTDSLFIAAKAAQPELQSQAEKDFIQSYIDFGTQKP